MNIELLITGIAIGLLTSAPIGPVNVLAIRRAVHYGFLPGLIAGFGALLADGVFATAAAFGVTAISDFVQQHEIYIQTVGGVLLIIFGIVVYRSQAHLKGSINGGGSVWRGLILSFVMTVTNPGVILGFIAIFGSLGERAPAKGDYFGALALVLGVLSGALLWWACLSALVSKLRNRMNDKWLAAINHTAGVVLLVFAGLILAKVAQDVFF
ncbi:Arginine exporter protein ArgO [Pseudovibrio axinellae]|uniref:Arginine exporter protein ArgO n=1 Tax=Pseudovibrio axinellae TaxID=989403 RepID=A0A165YGX5_9HYPH|nr:LysE family transporter [Pseudovibrio axinellae]KZL18833.1 Arginine exporter protein ArgO [Pseudovibrio axinellae]SEP91116.1 Threonine/homoserine/homoserine lactone efflux protein [Pseudovibrio axinellae]